jgi:hypothetical protein
MRVLARADRWRDAQRELREWIRVDVREFPTSTGSRRDRDNARERVIRPVVAAADELLVRRGHQPLPAGVTAHKIRPTFASLLYVRGEDPPCVMAQLGHADPGFTLRVYAHAMRRDERDKERLSALVEGRDWAPLGTGRPFEAPGGRNDVVPETTKALRMQGLQEMGAAGFEPATSRV